MNRLTRRTTVAVATAVALVALAGCKGDDASSKETTGKSPATTAAGGTSTPSGSTSKVSDLPSSFNQKFDVLGKFSIMLPGTWQKSELLSALAPDDSFELANTTHCTTDDLESCPRVLFSDLNAASVSQSYRDDPINLKDSLKELRLHGCVDGTSSGLPERKASRNFGGVVTPYYEQDICPESDVDLVSHTWLVKTHGVYMTVHTMDTIYGKVELDDLQKAFPHVAWMKHS